MAASEDGIPSPPGLPILGNVLDIQNEIPIKGIEHLLDIYGPIIKLNLFGKQRITIGSVELLEEVADEKRFWKSPGDAVAALSGNKQKDSHSGLFSAPTEDSMDWQQAHRTLMPAFGPLAIQEMFGEMHDVASQLVLKWARMGPSHRIPVTEDFTRLTLDTIALCAMDYRFNSFYQDELHPFVQAMTDSLSASNDRLKIGAMLRKMMPWDKSAEKVKAARQYMGSVARDLVRVRRENPTEKKDLLNAMVNGVDPKTGDKMPDGLISANMVTFLIAGHETTSGLLSFAFLFLLTNPETYFKAQQEVDEVIGRKRINPHHIKDLHYLNAVLRETLRLCPTVPAFVRGVRPDNPKEFEYIGGGKYRIDRDDRITCLIAKVQRDPKVYGDDAEQFKPERMLDENFNKLPKAAWKPFGTGVRSCIGRAFAWQEALMAVALLLQNFNFRLNDPNYQLKIRQTLTLKPDAFFMHATLRDGITATSLQAMLSSPDGSAQSAVDEGIKRVDSGLGKDLKPMRILYGSNTGTCQSLAQKLSVEARRHGYHAEVVEMDAAVDVLPKDQPIAIITASYEGQPPDNAGQFVAWLESLKDTGSLEGVQYAVFGCGHSDWVNTYQRIPNLVDTLIAEHGGKRLAERGLANAAAGDIFSDFDNWTDHTFWPAVAPSSEPSKAAPVLDVEMSTQNRSSYLRQDVQTGTVVKASTLTGPGEPEKRHLDIKLPEGMTYVTGDYLAVLPLNPVESIAKVTKHFKIPADATIMIKPGAATFLPTNVTISVTDLLQGFVELGLPATKKDVQACVDACTDDAEKVALQAFLEKESFAQLAAQRISLLDLLLKYPSVPISFSAFISMLPPLRPRHYSISSSPLADPTTCSITYGVINEAAKSGTGQYVGVAGAFLSALRPGDEVSVSVRATNKFFHLPADAAATPIIMFGAGTGLAPFRGFVQERAVQLAAGRPLAPALLFVGCRSPTADRLYAAELDAWAAAGAVDLRYAFSRAPADSAGCRYVQDRVARDRADVLRLWEAGAKVFTCGGPAVSEGVAKVAQSMLVEGREKKGEKMTEEEANEWFRKRRNERFVVDVFA